MRSQIFLLASLLVSFATPAVAQSGRPRVAVHSGPVTRSREHLPETVRPPSVATHLVRARDSYPTLGIPAEPFRESIAITRQIIAGLDVQISRLEAENNRRLAQTVAPARQLRRSRRDLSFWRGLKCLGALCAAPVTGGASVVVGGALAIRDTRRLNATDRDIRTNNARRTEIERQIANYRQRKAALEVQLRHLRSAEQALNARLPSEPPQSVEEAADQVHVSQGLLTNLRGQSGHLVTIRDSAAAVGLSIDQYAVQLGRAVTNAEQRVAQSQRDLLRLISIAASSNPAVASARFLEREFISLTSRAMVAAGLGRPFAELLAETLVAQDLPDAPQIRATLVRELVAHAR